MVGKSDNFLHLNMPFDIFTSRMFQDAAANVLKFLCHLKEQCKHLLSYFKALKSTHIKAAAF